MTDTSLSTVARSHAAGKEQPSFRGPNQRAGNKPKGARSLGFSALDPSGMVPMSTSKSRGDPSLEFDAVSPRMRARNNYKVA